ncbi:dihydroorotase [Aequitasia blattaphilus]|uniref:Dihydroorotase n=1 Tax=Aequitasia blattaphilus TaxID=2949332 RepID=A0ABT1ECF9_9FIRM|nr:dihydroorotase [Aequitasia blattaphilus]MCP1102632.1 dihydroorotase [Aequitasia blattaphilus]MCR8615272.1 dihydroorotase [Aequitasia blattaphilus]
MKILIKKGRVVDPKTDKDEISDVLIQDGIIQKVEKNIEEKADRIIDAENRIVMPGFIDMHVHLRDPGLTYKEDLKSGGLAAAKGGITTMLAMPNTKPVIDTKDKVEDVHRRAKEETKVNVIQLGAVTYGQEGKEVADIKGMAQAGCKGISEDGKSVMDSAVYRQGMKLAKENDLLVLAHCEDINLVEGGVMNADETAKKMGFKGITNAVEDVIVARDILLAKETGVRLHLCHCSTKDSVRMLEEAKKDHICVTAEVCPHHFVLTTEDIKRDDGNFKMNPPLRTREDVDALIEGLKNGAIDVIATDHAPHSQEEKEKSIQDAAFGIVGLETCAALTYTYLVQTGKLTLMEMADKMSYAPAKILNLEGKGSVSEGMIGDLVIFDIENTYKIDKSTFQSKGHNTPFDGYEVKGMVTHTIIDGNIVYEAGGSKA